MPTHHGLRLKASLVISDLDRTTTSQPEYRRGHAEKTRNDLERCEFEVKNGRELKESFIPLGGDDFNTLHFLGEDSYMPFMMVRAGKELRQNPAGPTRVFHPNAVRNAIYARVLGDNPPDVVDTPHALAIRLDISEQTFLKTDRPMEDIKIDVLFNGKFTHATTCPARHAKEKKVFVFGGIRTHYMLERAWVVLPRDKNADGTQRQAAPRTETPQDRWKELSQAISEEVDVRTTQAGGRTPVIEYFDALAKMGMPPEFDQWDDRRTQTYSVIDVVLSYGHGGKDPATAPYLNAPVRLRPRMQASILRTAFHTSQDSSEIEKLDFTGEMPGHRTISDVEIRKDENVVTSSEPLPKYLAAAMEKSGLDVQTTSEKTHRWNTAREMLSNVLNRSHPNTNATTAQKAAEQSKEPTTPLRSLPPPISPPKSTWYSQGRLKEIPVTNDFKLPPGAQTPTSLVRNTSRMSLQSPLPPVTPFAPNTMPPPPRVTRSGNRYTTISQGSPRKRRRSRSPSPSSSRLSTVMGVRSPAGIGISNRGVFTTAGSSTDVSAMQAPAKQYVNPDIVLPPPLSPIRSDRKVSDLEKPFTRVVFRHKSRHIRTLQLPQPPFRLSNLHNDIVRARNQRSALASMKSGIVDSPFDTNMPAGMMAMPPPTSSMPPPPSTTPSRSHTKQASTTTTTTTTTTMTGRRIANARGPARGKSGNAAAAQSATSDGLIAPGNQPYTLFPNPYTTPTLASPFATTTTSSATAASMTAAPRPSQQQQQSPSRPRAGRSARGPRRALLPSVEERSVEHEAAFHAFAAPPLSADASVSYSAVRPAYRGTQWTQGMPRGAGGGVVRQIRTERGGEFNEEGIVLGVRFVVL